MPTSKHILQLTDEEVRLAIIGLQCACALSEDNGHKDQARGYRDLWVKLDLKLDTHVGQRNNDH